MVIHNSLAQNRDITRRENRLDVEVDVERIGQRRDDALGDCAVCGINNDHCFGLLRCPCVCALTEKNLHRVGER